jgi:hypothetical protein
MKLRASDRRLGVLGDRRLPHDRLETGELIGGAVLRLEDSTQLAFTCRDQTELGLQRPHFCEQHLNLLL